MVTSSGSSHQPVLTGTLLPAESLASHTSWRVGGAATYFYYPRSVEDWSVALQQIPVDMSVQIWGLGSNILVRDGGIPGWVMALHKGLSQIHVWPDGRIWAEAGVPTAKLARYAAESGFAQAAFWAGIPGTVGGALCMNAGAFGGETWDFVETVQVINRQGVIATRPASDYQWGYRYAQLRAASPTPEWFVGAVFQFCDPTSPEHAKAAIREGLKRRNAKQPIGIPSGGSVFKNPTPHYAGALIEQAGLKGLQMGGAQISEQHANFIVNRGGARAADIEALIEKTQETVWARFGIGLIPEVRIVGVYADHDTGPLSSFIAEKTDE